MTNRPALFPLLFLLLLVSSPDLAFSRVSPAPSAQPPSSPASFLSAASRPLSPSPGPSQPSPSPSPSPSPVPVPSPVPAPAPMNPEKKGSGVSDSTAGEGGSRGMSGGRKAGIVIGVLAAAAVIGLGAFVYMKRRDNVRRSRFGYNFRVMEMV